jgi:hypothetical protein
MNRGASDPSEPAVRTRNADANRFSSQISSSSSSKFGEFKDCVGRNPSRFGFAAASRDEACRTRPTNF